jgi:DNA-binding NarL/FixJ family response regulator
VPKIVMVTAFGRDDIRARAEKIGIDGYLLKPVNPSTLYDTLMNLFAVPGQEGGQVSSAKEAAASPDARGVRVLLVEDNELNQQVASELLESAGATVTIAHNGREAVRILTEGDQPPTFDVVLMDLQMPEMDGIEAMSEILAEFPKARIVMLTTYSGDIQASRALKLGAMGYLLKGLLRTDLVKTIRAVHSGIRCVPSEVAKGIAIHLAVDHLSERELQVLRLVADGNSNKVIAAVLGVTEDTVKGHMRNVMLKLQANDRTHAVTLAMKRGYLNG